MVEDCNYCGCIKIKEPEDSFCYGCKKYLDRLKSDFPQVYEIKMKYLNKMMHVLFMRSAVLDPELRRFIPSIPSSFHNVYQEDIIDEIWELNLPPDPDCPNKANFGGRNPSGLHKSSSWIGSKGFCGYCYCRGDWA